jgi:hypothetical protein
MMMRRASDCHSRALALTPEVMDSITAGEYNALYGRPTKAMITFSPLSTSVVWERDRRVCAMCGLRKHGDNLTVAMVFSPTEGDIRYEPQMVMSQFTLPFNGLLMCYPCLRAYLDPIERDVKEKVKDYLRGLISSSRTDPSPRRR